MKNAFLRCSVALHLAAPPLALLGPASFRWPLLGALVADHLVVVGSGLTPRSTLLGPNVRRLDPESVPETTAALTFDDGPDPATTPGILALLDDYGATASFFCIGDRVRRFADLAARIVERGHRLENHTFDHPSSFYFYGRRAMARQIDRAQEVIREVSGRSPAYFRAPAGIRNPLLQGLLDERDLKLVSWTRRAFDTVTDDVETIVGRLSDEASALEILLLHDRTTASGRATVLEALPPLLERLVERGLRLAALPDPLPSEATPLGER